MDGQDQNRRTVQAGDQITLRYTLSLTDGTEVDVATAAEPFTFKLGDGALIPGLESLLIGLEKGEPQHFLVAAEEAFGLPDPAQVHPMSLDSFDPNSELEPGTIFSFEAPSGELVPATIERIEEGMVWVDFNHPLAGRDLRFEVEVMAIGADDEN